MMQSQGLHHAAGAHWRQVASRKTRTSCPFFLGGPPPACTHWRHPAAGGLPLSLPPQARGASRGNRRCLSTREATSLSLRFGLGWLHRHPRCSCNADARGGGDRGGETGTGASDRAWQAPTRTFSGAQSASQPPCRPAGRPAAHFCRPTPRVPAALFRYSYATTFHPRRHTTA